jgi:hypothetical protein
MRAVDWPEELHPDRAHVFAHNELETRATPEAIWPWLVQATRWPEIYANCRGLRLYDGATELALGTRFTWWTFGVRVETVVDGFEPNRYLAWSGAGLGARGYHAWILEPTARGCRFVTEETQRGPVVRLLSPLLRRGLLHFHQRWLEGLARAALREQER